jgi:Tol biopolymer transport system component
MNPTRAHWLAVVTLWLGCLSAAGQQGGGVGVFKAHGDVGDTASAGSADFDAATKSYRVSGGGTNMWAAVDAFHFVWKRVSADSVTLTADVSFPRPGGDPHRKACLIIRQTLDADSPYVDAAQHGDGLTSLQYREAKGGRTSEVQANVKGPRRLRLEKRGQDVSLWVAAEGQELKRSGASIRVKLDEPFYVGLAVCAHDNKALEQAVFANVELTTGAAAAAPPQPTAPGGKPQVISTLETIAIASKDRRVVHVSNDLLEAPNWSKDDHLYYNSKGRIFRIPSAGGEPQAIDTGFATRCNNDHGLSPDGKLLAISDQSQTVEGRRPSLVYTVPIGGGTPTRVTARGPSYWHGWSPDGKTIVFCGERNGEFDVYSVPAAGGEETRLTTAPGLDDGPEFSPDGKYVYFNSDRTGTMQVWRMAPDGSNPEQVTSDEYQNWFAHPSPDGKWLVFLSYEKDVTGHPENKDVTLRIMPAAGGKIDVLAKLFGGQGTINVPSWSADGKRLAFVSYQVVR